MEFEVADNKIIICAKQCPQTTGYGKKYKTLGKRGFLKLHDNQRRISMLKVFSLKLGK